MSKTCNDCKTQNTNMPVPYIAYESEMARNEREKKRLWILVIISWIVTFLIVGIFTYERLQYDYSGTTEEITIEAEQDGEGVNIVGGGNVDYGAESKTNNSQENENKN